MTDRADGCGHGTDAGADSDPGTDADLEAGSDSSTDSDPAAAARKRVLCAHRDAVAGVVAAADAVAASWDGPAARDREAVVDPLAERLRAAGLLDRLPAVLADAAGAAGYALPAEPVAAPPYVVVTGRGPVLRATVADGRLVVALAVVRVERDPVRYVRDGDRPGEVVEASFVPDGADVARDGPDG